ncbi:hypothetical protein Ocepr_2264 (plasmid) [Oceanithermus profundus DSM 14977]|uniref:Uncharacterized protein n=1 Tax=Oceanithermus profundus (strain DSM 14977 / NBRC 100410 / VKM B-2274 / 506) TaxID=670487 RepID=E4UAS7_OCEP5|nr:hypothetical protein [Oceanithermus profundus]ADR37712.1 hypothetical protein Ocepr_2264 [Oceanithermus profundus DSM 14977]
MNQELLLPAARIAGLEPAEAERLGRKLPPCFSPEGPYAVRILANALAALKFFERNRFEVYLTGDAREAIERSADPRLASACFGGPALLLHHPKAPAVLLYVLLPGKQLAFSGTLAPGLPDGLEHLGAARNLGELRRFANDERLHGKLKRISGVPSEEVRARAAALAASWVIEAIPEEIQALFDDFEADVADEVRFVAGLPHDHPLPAVPERIDHELEALAGQIASEVFLVELLRVYMDRGEAKFYLLERLGHLVPDHADRPGVLVVAPLVNVGWPRFLKRKGLGHEVNYAVPFRLTELEGGGEALITAPPYVFENARELERTLRELGGRYLGSDFKPGELIDALKKREPRP